MEADWEFEVGGEAPVIEAQWPGFVDLRQNPKRALEFSETAEFPALADALAKLNADDSPVWTSKCDFWPHLSPGEFDPDELDAPPECSACAMGCFIDVLPRSNELGAIPEEAADYCKNLRGTLRAVPLRCCRVDFVMRRAFITADLASLGITAYLTACGPTSAEAAKTLQAALAAFVGAVCGQSTLE